MPLSNILMLSRCRKVIADNITYPKLERACKSDKESKAILKCLRYEQCTGTQKVPKLRFSKILTEMSRPISKIQ